MHVFVISCRPRLPLLYAAQHNIDITAGKNLAYSETSNHRQADITLQNISAFTYIIIMNGAHLVCFWPTLFKYTTIHYTADGVSNFITMIFYVKLSMFHVCLSVQGILQLLSQLL